MNNSYFDLGIYDHLFLDKIIYRGAEIYLSNKIYNIEKNANICTCKVQGNKLYDVKIIFNEINDNEIETATCTCPFAQEGNYCKHMYALLLKLKCNYHLDTIKKEKQKGLKELKQIFKSFDKDYINFKYNNPQYLSDIENLKKQMNCFKNMHNKILENNKNNISDIVVLKDITNLKKILYERIDNFNEYISLKIRNNIDNTEKFSEPINKENYSSGLFDIFINVLDNIKKDEVQKDKEYEEIKQRYRRVIKEQNLYDGKINEDIYDGLDD